MMPNKCMKKDAFSDTNFALHSKNASRARRTPSENVYAGFMVRILARLDLHNEAVF